MPTAIRESIRKYSPYIFLLLSAWVLVHLRLHTLDEPFGTDQSIYAYIGHQMLSGEELYADLVDNKPPGIYFLFMLAEIAGGYQQSTYIWLGIVFSLLSLLVLFFILKRAANTPTAVAGAFIWALASGSFRLEANHPNTELFINFFILLAIWGLQEFLLGKRQWLWVTGLAIGCGSLLKTNIVFLFAALLFLVAWEEYRNRRQLKQSLMTLCQLVFPIVLLWGGVYGYFSSRGTWDDFIDVVFKALSVYAGNIVANEISLLTHWKYLFPGYLIEIAILFPAAIAWLIWDLKRRTVPLTKTLLAVAIGTLFIIGSVHLKPHVCYYQMWFPFACLGSAMGLFGMTELIKTRQIKTGKSLRFLVTALIFGYLGAFQLQYLMMTPEEISFRKHDNGFLVERALGQMLKNITSEQESIFQWGLGGSIYFHSQRKAASGIIINHILYFGRESITLKYLNKTVNDLITRLPAFYIVCDWSGKYHNSKVFNVIKDHYRFFGTFGTYVIYERKDRPQSLVANLNEYKNREFGFSPPLARLRLPNISDPPPGRQRILIKVSGEDPYGRLVNEGVRLALSGQLEAALAKFYEAQTFQPERLEAVANASMLHEKNGELWAALVGYQKLIRVNPSPWEAYYEESLRQLEYDIQAALAKEKPEGISLMNRIFVSAQGRDEYARLVQKGLESAKAGNFPQAENYFDKAVLLDPQRPEARANRGVIRERSRKYHEALEDYEIAMEKLKSPWSEYYKQLKERLKNK